MQRVGRGVRRREDEVQGGRRADGGGAADPRGEDRSPRLERRGGNRRESSL